MTPPAVPPPSDKEQIFVWVTYKPEEVNDGYWLIYREIGLPTAMITVFCLAFALGVGGVVANLGNFEPVNGIILLALAGFVIPPLLCLYAYMIVRGRLARSYENRPNFHFPMLYTLSQLGCQVEYASGAGLLDWRHFTLAIETPAAFCLASSVDDVFVLPKRCLAGETEVGLLRDLIKGHVREFRKARGRSVDIAFEKAAIQQIIDHGIDEVMRAVEEAEAKKRGEGAEASEESADGFEESAAVSPESAGQDREDSVSRSGEHAHAPVLQFSSPLKSGLAIEISYLPGEIMKAEKIYFFRKRLIALATLYITYLLWLPLSFLAIGYIWGMLDYCQSMLNEVRPLAIFILPIFFCQAAVIYLVIRRRTRQNEELASPFVFQFTEEGCGVRAGERYAVLAWWHFRECWETEDQFLVLVGQRGNAMYVIPKRAFPDQSGLRYLKGLLQRKIPRYKDLIDEKKPDS